jgi:hypothetical protein
MNLLGNSFSQSGPKAAKAIALALEDSDGTNTGHENRIPLRIAIWVEDNLYVRLNSEPRSDV